ncbi:MAG TPA: hypothetical protein VFV50_10645 [Bdellovibrionales bacterium]|nr:hypothetical protein [Bdellovibrionales bacterium]
MGARISPTFLMLVFVTLASSTARAEFYVSGGGVYQLMNLTNDIAVASNTEFKTAYGASLEAGFAGDTLSFGLRVDYLGYKIRAGSVSAELVQMPAYVILGWKMGDDSYLKPFAGAGQFQTNKADYKGLPSAGDVTYENKSNLVLVGAEAALMVGRDSYLTLEAGYRHQLDTTGKIKTPVSGVSNEAAMDTKGIYARVGLSF